MLCACSTLRSNSDFENMKDEFLSNRQLFEKLRFMTIEDIGDRYRIEIEDGRIGKYQNEGRIWGEPFSDYKMTFEEVLSEYGLTHERYREYLKLLKAINAKSISYSSMKRFGSEKYKSLPTFILLDKSGWGMSEYSGDVWIRHVEYFSETDNIEADPEEIIFPLSDGWSIVYDKY